MTSVQSASLVGKNTRFQMITAKL